MEITSTELQEKIKNGEKLVVDFWANFCAPCRMMKPIFEKVGGEVNQNNSEVSYYTFDVESDREFVVSLGIKSIPTIKTFSGGKEVTSQVGLLQENELKEMAKTLINE